MKPYLPRPLQNKWLTQVKKTMEFANIKNIPDVGADDDLAFSAFSRRHWDENLESMKADQR
ncbi:hypothetical protein [Herbaspirillum huttiense]|uniref:hypothetical protein n=1 Tax=Herbaspirillum huttiense TaxID=863372 RepID=UPI0039B07941